MLTAVLCAPVAVLLGRVLFEEQGRKLAGTIVPIACTAWSLWLIGAGVVLLGRPW